MLARASHFEPRFQWNDNYYVPWAKGTLNRHLPVIPQPIPYPGMMSPPWMGRLPDIPQPTQDYRNAVGLWQAHLRVPKTSLFDAIVQNSLIKADQASSAYLGWIKTALRAAGIGPGGRVATTIAEGLWMFQRDVLRLANPDGVPGPKTETGLIFISRTLPPGRTVVPPVYNNRIVSVLQQ